MRRSLMIAAAAVSMLIAAPSRADDVSNAMDEARRAYQGRDFAATRTALQEALQLLAQRAAADLAEALPGPLAGWTADEPSSQATAGAGMFGGATASRTYRNAEGQKVEIRVMSDNPMIAQLGVVLSNPMLAGAMGRLVRVGEQRAIQANDGDIQMLVDNRILVQVQGDAPPEARLAYARAIDLARLARR